MVPLNTTGLLFTPPQIYIVNLNQCPNNSYTFFGGPHPVALGLLLADLGDRMGCWKSNPLRSRAGLVWSESLSDTFLGLECHFSIAFSSHFVSMGPALASLVPLSAQAMSER